jgi:hypothetical protein
METIEWHCLVLGDLLLERATGAAFWAVSQEGDDDAEAVVDVDVDADAAADADGYRFQRFAGRRGVADCARQANPAYSDESRWLSAIENNVQWTLKARGWARDMVCLRSMLTADSGRADWETCHGECYLLRLAMILACKRDWKYYLYHTYGQAHSPEMSQPSVCSLRPVWDSESYRCTLIWLLPGGQYDNTSFDGRANR